MPDHKHRYAGFNEGGRTVSRCVVCTKPETKEDAGGGINPQPEPVELGGTGFARAEDNAPVEDPSGAEDDDKPSKK